MSENTVGSRIRNIRGNETQKEFAQRLDVKRTTLARYEAGESPPDAEFLLKLYSTCQIEPIWLLTGLVEQKVALSSEEHVLLSQFRAGSQELKNAALRVLLGGSSETMRIIAIGENNSHFAGNNYYAAPKPTDSDND